MTKRHSGFERGTGCFNCEVCGKKTRATGVVAIGGKLCVSCWDKAGDENAVADGQMSETEFFNTYGEHSPYYKTEEATMETTNTNEQTAQNTDTRQGERLNATVTVDDFTGDKTITLPSGTVLPVDARNEIRYDNVLGKYGYANLGKGILLVQHKNDVRYI